MSAPSGDAWPWLALAGLGAFHGLNPGMGWLFAVALGIHRRSRGVLLLALVPIALGHALSAALVLAAVAGLGFSAGAVSPATVAGLALLAWALWHAAYGHRRHPRIGMQAGLAALAPWSFLVASAHGAGLMLAPALLPLCGPSGGGAAGLGTALLGLGLHTGAMLAAMLGTALAVYAWSGVGVLRRAWVNLDAVWSGALAVSGALLLVA
ncbi:hypothetical protein OPKNFCMD_0435 [Methylobacterium crusticola]|uniref:Arginine/ornithine antiporter ArcD n=1 Tax=Methylobacterium crusticola TaxID=1697972 RepID=A0ABQ4QSH4_9HYPH|nr:hypothetical protein [Methylobacterium crusticola]GJD47725.1 hypothetical protein OPKNFCMD_0435 [Methylobacterium crusticola]